MVLDLLKEHKFQSDILISASIWEEFDAGLFLDLNYGLSHKQMANTLAVEDLPPSLASSIRNQGCSPI